MSKILPIAWIIYLGTTAMLGISAKSDHKYLYPLLFLLPVGLLFIFLINCREHYGRKKGSTGDHERRRD